MKYRRQTLMVAVLVVAVIAIVAFADGFALRAQVQKVRQERALATTQARAELLATYNQAIAEAQKGPYTDELVRMIDEKANLLLNRDMPGNDNPTLSRKVQLLPFVEELAHNLLKLDPSAMPQDLNAEIQNGVVHLYGTATRESVTVAGKKCGWLGKAVMLKEYLPQGSLRLMLPARKDSVKYYLLIRQQDDSVKYEVLPLEDGVTYNWSVMDNRSEVRVIFRRGLSEVYTVNVPHDTYSGIGFAASARYVGGAAYLIIAVE